jgi:hypothetical protein
MNTPPMRVSILSVQTGLLLYAQPYRDGLGEGGTPGLGEGKRAYSSSEEHPIH